MPSTTVNLRLQQWIDCADSLFPSLPSGAGRDTQINEYIIYNGECWKDKQGGERGWGVLFYVTWYEKLFPIRWHWDRDLKKYSCKSLYVITGRKNIPERGSQTNIQGPEAGMHWLCVRSSQEASASSIPVVIIKVFSNPRLHVISPLYNLNV